MEIEHKGKKYELDVEKAVRDGYLKDIEINGGDVYKQISTNRIYIVNGYFDQWALVNMETGRYYMTPNLKEYIFNGEKDDFVKIDNPLMEKE